MFCGPEFGGWIIRSVKRHQRNSSHHACVFDLLYCPRGPSFGLFRVPIGIEASSVFDITAAYDVLNTYLSVSMLRNAEVDGNNGAH